MVSSCRVWDPICTGSLLLLLLLLLHWSSRDSVAQVVVSLSARDWAQQLVTCDRPVTQKSDAFPRWLSIDINGQIIRSGEHTQNYGKAAF